MTAEPDAGDVEALHIVTLHERRMIRVMTKKGGKGFHILRSPERPLTNYSRNTPVPSEATEAGEGEVAP